MRILLLPLLALASLAHGADSNPAEAKLREGLRNTMLQLRTVQGERDTLQVEKAQLEQEKQALAAQVEMLTKKATADQEAATEKISNLELQNNRQAASLNVVQASLDKWKAAHGEASALATRKEAARAQSAQLAIELQRRIDEQQAKNLAMYKITQEILSRYESFGLGTAITAREPFVGAMRVRLENQVQEYRDKVQEQRLKPEVAKPAPAAAKPPPSTPSPAKAPKTAGKRA